jgi:hypothetical protein
VGFPVLNAWIAALILGGLLGLIAFILGVVRLFRMKQKMIFAILAILGSLLVVLLMFEVYSSNFIFTF